MSRAKKSAHQVETGVSELLHEAEHRVIDFRDESIETLNKRIDELGALMKIHPIVALAIGVGAGYVLGRLTRAS